MPGDEKSAQQIQFETYIKDDDFESALAMLNDDEQRSQIDLRHPSMVVHLNNVIEAAGKWKPRHQDNALKLLDRMLELGVECSADYRYGDGPLARAIDHGLDDERVLRIMALTSDEAMQYTDFDNFDEYPLYEALVSERYELVPPLLERKVPLSFSGGFVNLLRPALSITPVFFDVSKLKGSPEEDKSAFIAKLRDDRSFKHAFDVLMQAFANNPDALGIKPLLNDFDEELEEGFDGSLKNAKEYMASLMALYAIVIDGLQELMTLELLDREVGAALVAVVETNRGQLPLALEQRGIEISDEMIAAQRKELMGDEALSVHADDDGPAVAASAAVVADEVADAAAAEAQEAADAAESAFHTFHHVMAPLLLLQREREDEYEEKIDPLDARQICIERLRKAVFHDEFIADMERFAAELKPLTLVQVSEDSDADLGFIEEDVAALISDVAKFSVRCQVAINGLNALAEQGLLPVELKEKLVAVLRTSIQQLMAELESAEIHGAIQINDKAVPVVKTGVFCTAEDVAKAKAELLTQGDPLHVVLQAGRGAAVAADDRPPVAALVKHSALGSASTDLRAQEQELKLTLQELQASLAGLVGGLQAMASGVNGVLEGNLAQLFNEANRSEMDLPSLIACLADAQGQSTLLKMELPKGDVKKVETIDEPLASLEVKVKDLKAYIDDQRAGELGRGAAKP